MLRQKLLPAALLTTLLSVVIQPAYSLVLQGDDQQKGIAIAKEADFRDLGWNDSQSSMVMTLRNKQGEESTRNLRVKNLEVEGDGDKSLTVFDSPKDVRGTGFLSYSHITSADDQWLYLPALKRVKRISSKNKSGPFMGSEFSFEDLASFEVDKYDYRYLGDEVINDQDTYKVEMTPLYKFSGYTKMVAWMDKSEFRLQKMEYYDRKGDLLKTQMLKNYRLYLGKYWRAHDTEMINHQNSKLTLLKFDDYEFGTGITEKEFNKNALKRVR